MTKINVSNIQRFSTGDGPGIRTTVFFKGCGLRCPWCHNPETVSPKPQTLRYPSGVSVSYGRMMTPEEIAEDVSEDIEFYRAGGGVTLSGGEPLLQYEGAAKLSSLLQERGIDVLADTAGCVPWCAFSSVLPFVGKYYFDIKTADPEKYVAIGGDLALIAENLRKLISSGADVTVRIPFIPGFNSSDEDCRDICRLITGAGAVKADLLPFHRLGSSKYAALGLEYGYKNVQPPARETMERAAEIYREYIQTGIE